MFPWSSKCMWFSALLLSTIQKKNSHMFDQQILNKIVGIFSLNSIEQNNQTNILVLAYGTDVFGILTFWPSTVSYFVQGEYPWRESNIVWYIFLDETQTQPTWTKEIATFIWKFLDKLLIQRVHCDFPTSHHKLHEAFDF